MSTALFDRMEIAYRSRSSEADSFYRRTSVVSSGSRSFEQRMRPPGGGKRRIANRKNRKVAASPGSTRLRRNKHWTW